MSDYYFVWIALVIIPLINLWLKKPKLPISSGKSGVTVDYETSPKEWKKAAIKLTVIGAFAIIFFTILLFK